MSQPQWRQLEAVQVPNQVTVVDIRGTMRARADRQRESYAAVLERCYARVQRCASVGRTECTFTVPPLIVGLPLYSVERCARFVSSHLSRNGFRVVPSQRYDVVVISWDVWAAEEGDAADARDGTCPPSSETCPAPDRPRGPPSLPNARNTRPASSLQYQQQHDMLLEQQRKQGQKQKQEQEQEQQEKDRHMLSTKSGSKFRSIAEFKPNGRFVLRM